MVVAFADKLHMLPSEFRKKANSQDMVEMLALDVARDEDWRKNHDAKKSLAISKTKTDAERSADIDRLLGL